MADSPPPVLSAATHDELVAVIKDRGYLYSEEPFRLSSGALSHDYVDMRRALSAGPDLALGCSAVIEALDRAGIVYDAIGGMTMGADPIAHGVALVSGRSWYSVRKGEKDHGVMRRIEGTALVAGRPVVVVEDTVSTGGSLLDALDVVAASGARIVAALTVLDRGEVTAPVLAARGLLYLALCTYRDLGIAPIGGEKSPLDSSA
jgi:orotate phosphoribosyltransferase